MFQCFWWKTQSFRSVFNGCRSCKYALWSSNPYTPPIVVKKVDILKWFLLLFQAFYIWVGKETPSDIIQQIFNVPSFNNIAENMVSMSSRTLTSLKLLCKYQLINVVMFCTRFKILSSQKHCGVSPERQLSRRIFTSIFTALHNF